MTDQPARIRPPAGVLQIALGVFLGLCLFAAFCTGLAVLLAGLVLGAVRDAYDDAGPTLTPMPAVSAPVLEVPSDGYAVVPSSKANQDGRPGPWPDGGD